VRRRALFAVLGAAPVALAAALMPTLASARATVSPARRRAFAEQVATLERVAGGRLGVCLRNTVEGVSAGHRMDERFALCSTFKLPLAAMVLREVELGRLRGDQPVPVTASDLVPHAPVVTTQVDGGHAPLLTLVRAAQVESDNAAANLLLRLLGGPAALTAFARTMGDDHTRLDRYEPELNVVRAGDVRDTTTPEAFARLTETLLLSGPLTPTSRSTLWEWMRVTRTGLRRLRAYVPSGWHVGDKTGTAVAADMPSKHNDVALVHPPTGEPWVLTAYYEAPGAFDPPRMEDDAILAEVGRLAVEVMRNAESGAGGD
jgi:beta-lactamase class A